MTYAKFPNFQEGTPNNLHFITECRSKMKKPTQKLVLFDDSVKRNK